MFKVSVDRALFADDQVVHSFFADIWPAELYNSIAIARVQ